MELTTKTAKRMEEINRAMATFNTPNSSDAYTCYRLEKEEIISFKNELKENIDIITTKDSKLLSKNEKFIIKCECNFCKWSRNLIQEIENVEEQ